MIDHIFFDVDGTLTDGGIGISDDGIEIKIFQAKDGLLMRELPKIGFTTIIITGRDSNLTKIRADDLNITKLFQGIKDKATVLKSYIIKNNLNNNQFAYIGDDLNDYSAMKLCGFKACPADAAVEIKKICDFVSTKDGGQGAVREILEYILKQNGNYDEFIKLFGVGI